MNPFIGIGQQLVKLGTRLLGQRLTVAGRVFSLTTPEVYATLDQKSAIDNGFNANTPVYAITMKDARKVGSIPRYVFDATTTEEKAVMWWNWKGGKVERKALTRLEQHPLIELLNRPNPYQSQDAFFTLERAYYKICGESMVWLNRGDLERYRNADGSFDDMAIDRLPVLEMYVLPPHLVTVIPDPENVWGILGYILEVGDRLVMRKGDIIHCKDVNLSFDPSSRVHLRGMSPLQPGSVTAEEARSLALGSLRKTQNDGAKAIIANKTINAMTPEQHTQVKAVIDRKINNHDISGSVAALQGDWTLLNLAIDNRAMQMVELKDMSWKEICFLLEVPFPFFDTQTAFANQELVMVQWVTNTLIPACRSHDGEYNRVLLKAFNLEGRAFIGSDYSELPEVMKTMVESAKVMQEIWSITPNDVRRFLGYEPYDDPRFDEPWVTGGRNPLSGYMDPAAEAMAMEIEQQRLNDDRGGGFQ